LPGQAQRQVSGTQREHLEETYAQLSRERGGGGTDKPDDHQAHHLQRAQALVQAGVLRAGEAVLPGRHL
jgi:hypothetical protein